MFSGPNNRSPCLGQSTSQQHTFLNNKSNNYNFAMPSHSHQSRQFQSSSSNQFHWSGKGNRLNGKPATPQPHHHQHQHHCYYHSAAPSTPQSQRTERNFLSGVCDYMSKIIPHNNFSSKFSEKHKDMRDYPVILPTLPIQMTQPKPNIHTIITVATSPIMEAAVDAVMTTIFSAEDFPALSKPKPVPSVKELWEQESKKKLNESTNKKATRSQNSKCSRERQLSECSDDSFIVFFTEDMAIDENDDDDEDGDDDDVISTDDDSSDTEGPDSESVCKKKVHFDPNPPTIHIMSDYSSAAQEARKGEWEQYARDRDRFSNRIKFTAQILNPIFSKTHRDKIYKERFQVQGDGENQCDNQTTKSELKKEC